MNVGFPLPVTLDRPGGVLVAGCGGGYDVVCGLPVALALRSAGHRIHLASYSFAGLDQIPGAEQERPGLFRIHSRCEPPPSGYFPEGFLAQWWERTLGEEVSVWCYRDLGVAPLTDHLRHLRDRLELSAVFVVDGGVDGLFRGFEHDLGTPTLDTISILSAYQVPEVERCYVCTGFGTEGVNHEVRHVEALERLAELAARRALLGVSCLVSDSPEGKLFTEAVDALYGRMEAHWHSNMASSLRASMEGRFGYHSLTVKTDVSPIWVSPLQALYWFLRLDPVAELRPYLREALHTSTVVELAELIERTRAAGVVQPRRDIPI